MGSSVTLRFFRHVAAAIIHRKVLLLAGPWGPNNLSCWFEGNFSLPGLACFGIENVIVINSIEQEAWLKKEVAEISFTPNIGMGELALFQFLTNIDNDKIRDHTPLVRKLRDGNSDEVPFCLNVMPSIFFDQLTHLMQLLTHLFNRFSNRCFFSAKLFECSSGVVLGKIKMLFLM